MKTMRILAAAIVATCLGGTSCGGGHGSHTATSNLTGHWSGPISDDGGPGGSEEDGFVDVDFTQNGSTIGGTWQTSYPDVPSSDNSGTISGTVSGDSFDAAFTASDSSRCSLRLRGSREGEDEIIGTYVAQPCSASVSGNFDIVRD